MSLKILDYGYQKPFSGILGSPKKLAWPVFAYRLTLPRVSRNASIFEQLSKKINNRVASIFAYSIWRESSFVDLIGKDLLDRLIRFGINAMKSIKEIPDKKKSDQNERWIWSMHIVELSELLLGLLRTRNSGDEEIRMTLQPHQEVTKELTLIVENVISMVLDQEVFLYSRVKLNIPNKPEGDETPDLLFALRLYLSGDDGSRAIRITGVSDE